MLPLAMVTIALVAASTSLSPGVSARPQEPPPVVGPADRTAAPPSAARDWRWPVHPHPIGRRFDPPAVAWGAGHRGVDLHAPPGASVVSPAPGVVAFAGRVAGKGVVSIDHAGGLRSTYEPVGALVTAGQTVGRGQVVGVLLGESAPADAGTAPEARGRVPSASRRRGPVGHCSPDTCLHWGVRRNGTYLDPLSLVAPPRIVLLPLG